MGGESRRQGLSTNVKVALVIWGTELKMTQILFKIIFLNISEVGRVVLSKM